MQRYVTRIRVRGVVLYIYDYSRIYYISHMYRCHTQSGKKKAAEVIETEHILNLLFHVYVYTNVQMNMYKKKIGDLLR